MQLLQVIQEATGFPPSGGCLTGVLVLPVAAPERMPT